MRWAIACVFALAACASAPETPPRQVQIGPGRTAWEVTCDRGGMNACRNRAEAMCPRSYDVIAESESSNDGVRRRSMRFICRT